MHCSFVICMGVGVHRPCSLLARETPADLALCTHDKSTRHYNMYVSWLCQLRSLHLKVGLYFRRRQALCRALPRFHAPLKCARKRERRRPTCLYFPRRHQRASTRARKRGAAPDATKFNSAELSRFTPANSSNSANHVPVSRIEFAADRACTYVSELDTGQSARRVGVATR